MSLDVQMMMQFASQDFAVNSHRAGESIKPTNGQYALAPGDTAFVLGSHSEVDNDLIICQVLMPDDHDKEFPDWEDRYQKGYLLCRWHACGDKNGDVGWFARSGLVPIPREVFAKILADFHLGIEIEDNYNGTYPELVRYYRLHNVEVSTMRENASQGAAPLLCEACESPMVHIRIEHHSVGTYTAAYHTHDRTPSGNRKLFKAGEIKEEQDSDVKVICEEEGCGHVTQLCMEDLAMKCTNPNHNH